jgi:hypothetical protein
MRSASGLAAAIVTLLAIPAALVAENVFGGGADTAIHVGVGAGFVLLAIAVFDFPVPRWLTWVGAIAAGAFGSIFLLQAVSDVIPNEALHSLAFTTLGGPIERFLPEGVFAWFLGLLLVASQGRTRLIGWVVMPLVVGLEVGAGLGAIIGVEMPSLKILFLLPMVWLLFESAKRRTGGRTEPVARPGFAEGAAS